MRSGLTGRSALRLIRRFAALLLVAAASGLIAACDGGDAASTPATPPPPRAPSVQSLVITATPSNPRGYSAGEIIAVQVTFSEAVTVSGRPLLKLGIGEHLRDAVWNEDASDGASVVFEYVVTLQDHDENGISIGANALRVGDGRSAARPAWGRISISAATPSLTTTPNSCVGRWRNQPASGNPRPCNTMPNSEMAEWSASGPALRFGWTSSATSPTS